MGLDFPTDLFTAAAGDAAAAASSGEGHHGGTLPGLLVDALRVHHALKGGLSRQRQKSGLRGEQ